MKTKNDKIDESWRKWFPGTKEYKTAMKDIDDARYASYKKHKQAEIDKIINDWNQILDKKHKSWVEQKMLSSTGIKTKEDVIKFADQFRDMYGTGPESVKREEKNAFIRVLIQLLDAFSKF